MRRTILAWSACAAAALLPAFTAGSAFADGGGTALQIAGQVAPSTQTADSSATSVQDQPSNKNIQVAILSPDANTGDVSQSNESNAGSAAGNINGTKQDATQSQAGGSGTAVEQALQLAHSDQTASSEAKSVQVEPSNKNIQVAVFSPDANTGNVEQSNSSNAVSAAGNVNGTQQDVGQTQAGSGCNPCGGSGTGEQTAVQKASNDQSADSSAESKQIKPSNTNIAVAVLSPGANKGNVKQSNSSNAGSLAANVNGTKQEAAQTQGGGSGTGSQTAVQKASNDQSADSSAESKQIEPSNTNIPVAILSEGANQGDVQQSNDSNAVSLAGNINGTKQSADQTQSGDSCIVCGGYGKGYGAGTGVQILGQEADSTQSASSEAESTQVHPSNTNIPVSIFGSGSGSGDVTQSNSSNAFSAAGNINGTKQDAVQAGGGSGTGVQVIGQLATNQQDATSDATSEQFGASNVNAPISLGGGWPSSPCCGGYEPPKSPCCSAPVSGGGNVDQSNSSNAFSAAGNINGTLQNAVQGGGGSGTGVQVIGQLAINQQDATSHATSEQFGASNVNAPISLGGSSSGGPCCGGYEPPTSSCCGGGSTDPYWTAKDPKALAPVSGGGDVTQSNSSSAFSAAGNINGTLQNASQWQGGGNPCGNRCGSDDTLVQVIGQAVENCQSATSEATSTQKYPSNLNLAFTGGDPTQSNASHAGSAAGNVNGTKQGSDQSQGQRPIWWPVWL